MMSTRTGSSAETQSTAITRVRHACFKHRFVDPAEWARAIEEASEMSDSEIEEACRKH